MGKTNYQRLIDEVIFELIERGYHKQSRGVVAHVINECALASTDWDEIDHHDRPLVVADFWDETRTPTGKLKASVKRDSAK